MAPIWPLCHFSRLRTTCSLVVLRNGVLFCWPICWSHHGYDQWSLFSENIEDNVTMHVTVSFDLVSNSFYYHTESYLLLFMKHMKTNYFHSLNNIVFIVVWNSMRNSYVIITPQQWIKLMKIYLMSHRLSHIRKKEINFFLAHMVLFFLVA